MLRKYPINENYFENIDSEEKAYFLGLIAADGCIVNNLYNYKTLVLTQSEKDKDILYRLRDSMEAFTKPITTYKDPENIRLTRYTFSVGSRKITNDLLSLGITTNKTHTLKFPTISDKLLNHFIRGYFDGDGSVWISSGKLFINFASSESFIDELQIILNKKINFNFTKKIFHRNIWYCQYSGNRQLKRFYEFLYNDATIYYERKKLKFKELIT